MSFCLFTGEGVPHVTITHDTYHTTVQVPGNGPAFLWTSDMGPPGLRPLLVTFSDHRWRPYQFCSLADPPTVLTSAVYRNTMVGKLAVRISLECFLVKICRCTLS